MARCRMVRHHAGDYWMPECMGLKRLDALEAKATPAPWGMAIGSAGVFVNYPRPLEPGQDITNAQLVCVLRNAWPTLSRRLALAERLAEALEKIAGMTPCFDAKGTASQRVNDIARAALSEWSAEKGAPGK